MANQQATVRYYCYAPLCSYSSKRSDEPSRHWRLEHSDLGQYDRKEILRLTLQEGEQHVQAIREARRRLEEPQLGTELETDLETELPSSDNNMDRPHRTQRPTEKVKPAVTAKRADDPLARPVIPPRYALPEHDPKWFAPPKEVARIYDHTKTSLTTGEEIKFYRLGPHVESKDKYHYKRAQRDEATNLFHAVEAPPFYARISDEEHPLCALDNQPNFFTMDMLTQSCEKGQGTTRANVFAREGTYYWEAKIISQSPEKVESQNEALITTQLNKGVNTTDTLRGTARVGFARREHHHSVPLGSDAYSYGIRTWSENAHNYGNVMHNSRFHFVKPNNPGCLHEGDVVGLMITLPSLTLHKKVVDGSFDHLRDAPELSIGPAVHVKPKKNAAKGNTKSSKSKVGKKVVKAAPAEDPMVGIETSKAGPAKPYVADIIRDRFPIYYKNIIYHESTEYAQIRDLQSSANTGKGININPATGKRFDMSTDGHPNHELVHMRTLPGSKIEMWVNGEYKGIAWEHLFAFLPPASYIEAINKRSAGGAWDDGTLGYYPAFSVYGGGTIQCKFDGPWWVGPPADRKGVQPFGVRYTEQIIEDVVSDVIDELCWELAYEDVNEGA